MKRKKDGRGRPKGEKTVVKRIPEALTVDNIISGVRKIVSEELDKRLTATIDICNHEYDAVETGTIPVCRKCGASQIVFVQ